MQKTIKIIFVINFFILISCIANLYIWLDINSKIQDKDKLVWMVGGAEKMYGSMSGDEFVANKKKTSWFFSELKKESTKRHDFVREANGALVQYSWALLILSLFSISSLFIIVRRCIYRNDKKEEISN